MSAQDKIVNPFGEGTEDSILEAVKNVDFTKQQKLTVPGSFSPGQVRAYWNGLRPETRKAVYHRHSSGHLPGSFASLDVLRGSLTDSSRRDIEKRKEANGGRAGLKSFGWDNIVKLSVVKADGTNAPLGASTVSLLAPGSAGFDVSANDGIKGLSGMMNMFGAPPKNNQPLPSWGSMPMAYHTYPTAIAGIVKVLETTLLIAVTDIHTWQLSVWAPLQVTETEKIAIFRYTFDDDFLDRMPHETPARTMNHRSSKSSVLLVRWGKGIMAEYGFWSTGVGQAMFAFQIKQLANAILLTWIFGAILELLHSVRAPHTEAEKQGRPLNFREHEDAKAESIRQFDQLKKKDGLDQFGLYSRSWFEERRRPTSSIHAVLTDRILACIAESAWKRDYQETGKPRDSAIDPRTVSSIFFNDIHIQKSITTGAYSKTDLFRMTAMHGEFSFYDVFKMCPTAFSPAFQTQHAVFQVYVDSANMFVPVYHNIAFRHSNLYAYADDADGMDADADADMSYADGRSEYHHSLDAGYRKLATRATTHRANPFVTTKLAVITPTGYLHIMSLMGKLAFTENKVSGQMAAYTEAIENSITGNHDAGNCLPTVGQFVDWLVTKNKISEAAKNAMIAAGARARFPGAAPPPPAGPRGDAKGAEPPVSARFDEFMSLRLHNSEAWDACAAFHIPNPMPIVLAVPHQLRYTHAAAAFIPGAATTWIMKPMCSLGKNSKLFTMFYTATAYSKTHAQDDSSVINPFACVIDYIAGNDETYLTTDRIKDYMKMRKDQTYDASHLPSRIVMALAPGEEIKTDCIDLTGRFADAYNAGANRVVPEHYTTAPLYRDILGLQSALPAYYRTGEFFTAPPLGDNTILYRAEMKLPSLRTGGGGLVFDVRVPGAGHMAHCTYPGCRDARKGMARIDYDYWERQRCTVYNPH